MWKKLHSLFSVFDKFNLVVSDLKALFLDFEHAYEDGRISPVELSSFLISLIRILRRIFPSL